MGYEIAALSAHELADIHWAGGPLHLQSVAEALGRVPSGQVEYLAVRDCVDRLPVAIGAIDFGLIPDCGVLWQLSTHPDLRGRGLGTALILALEGRARARGCARAALRVEPDNVRARRLYERLSYEEHRHLTASWTIMRDGRPGRYDTVVCEMRKELF